MYQPYGIYAPYGSPLYGNYMGYGGMGYGGTGSGGMGYGGALGDSGTMEYGDYSPYGMYSVTPAASSQAEVTIYDHYFEPRTVYVTPGGAVRWVNKGRHAHTVTDYAGHWGSKEIRPGQSYTFTLPTALNHHYYCSHHPLEMNGSIVVRPPQSALPQGLGLGPEEYSFPDY
jgi:plastocyanin